jgi:O-acetyl-ADP-ribose deacetylase (regulator of RNase III)
MGPDYGSWQAKSEPPPRWAGGSSCKFSKSDEGIVAPVGEHAIELSEGDITRVAADAIVNAANAALRGGGGVDGAIHRAAGPELMTELRTRYPDGTPTGTAVVSAAHRLPARWVIHAVGPVYRDGRHGEPELLAAAYRESLRLAADLGARSVALPAISTGVYGYPLDEAAPIAIRAVADALAGTSIELATFVLHGERALAAFRRALDELGSGGARR